MLKITAVENERRRTLVLEGKLVEPWLGELEQSWAEAQRSPRGKRVMVDLKDVTAISPRGEDLLLAMIRSGATLHCGRGVLTKHVLRQLEQRRGCECGKGTLNAE